MHVPSIYWIRQAESGKDRNNKSAHRKSTKSAPKRDLFVLEQKTVKIKLGTKDTKFYVHADFRLYISCFNCRRVILVAQKVVSAIFVCFCNTSLTCHSRASHKVTSV
jgi:hypothetical protein